MISSFRKKKEQFIVYLVFQLQMHRIHHHLNDLPSQSCPPLVVGREVVEWVVAEWVDIQHGVAEWADIQHDIKHWNSS
jgi:hypothetical protein